MTDKPIERKPIITSMQLGLLALGSAFMFPYTFMPILRTPPANQDSWFPVILMPVYIITANLPLLFLMNKFRGMNINEMVETVLGKFFGKIASVIFASFMLFCYSACSLMGAMFVNIFMFPDTPMWAILLYTIVPVAYAVSKGAGTIGRLAAFITPIIMLTVVLFLILGINKMDLRILQPVLTDSTFLELNLGAFYTASRYSEIMIFMIFSYFLKQKASINKTYATSLFVFMISLLMIVVPTLTVLGSDLAKHAFNPYYTYTRQVEGYDFIERMQSVNSLTWFLGMILKLSIYCFMACYVLAGVVKAKSHKPFIIPLSIVAFVVCLLPFMNKTSTIILLRSDEVFPFIILPIIFGIPLVIVIVYFFRRKKINMILEQKLAAGLLSDTEYEESRSQRR